MSRSRPYGYESLDEVAKPGGVNRGWTATTKSYAKRGSARLDPNPYLIANEWIAACIGHALRLPVPPFSLLRRHTEKVLFSTLHFSKDSIPDDVAPSVLWRDMPELTTGVLLFDIFIANYDRHNGNIKVDDRAHPKRLFVFDHDKAVLGEDCSEGAVSRRFSSLEKRLGTSGGAVSRGRGNCLLEAVESTEHFGVWIEAISEIPDRYLREICFEVVDFGITVELADLAYNFLKERKRVLDDILRNNRDAFTQIAQWGIF